MVGLPEAAGANRVLHNPGSEFLFPEKVKMARKYGFELRLLFQPLDELQGQRIVIFRRGTTEIGKFLSTI